MDGRRDPLTHRDVCKATRLFVFVNRLGRVRVPPLALLTTVGTVIDALRTTQSWNKELLVQTFDADFAHADLVARAVQP